MIDNPYLDDFYGDMSRWAFHLQVYFLSKRFASQREIEAAQVSCVQDRTIYEDVEIFARTLHNRGHLVGRDWDNYRDLFETMMNYLTPPDLIIYLRCDVDTLMRRIRARGRPSEMSMNPAYLAELNEAYEALAAQRRQPLPHRSARHRPRQRTDSGQVLAQSLELLRCETST